MKQAKLILLPLSILTLVSCGQTNDVSSASSSSASSSSSSIETSSSSSNPFIDSQWGEKNAETMFDTIGEVLPYFESNGFEIEETTDSTGDPALWIYLYCSTDEEAEAKADSVALDLFYGGYTVEIKEGQRIYADDYYVEADVLYADKVLDEKRAIEIMGLSSRKSLDGVSTPCYGLFCFNYIPVDHTKWPTYAASVIAEGENLVPEIAPQEGYNYDFRFYTEEDITYLVVYIDGDNVGYDLEETYFNACLDGGYKIKDYYEEGYDDDYVSKTYNKGDKYPGYEVGKFYFAHDTGKASDIIGKPLIYFYYSVYYSCFIVEIYPYHRV